MKRRLKRHPAPLPAAAPRTGARRASRGATLLEAIAFLSVASIVILGALALFGSSFQSAASERLVQESNAVAANVRAAYLSAGTGGYAKLSMTDLYDAKAFPATLQASLSGTSVTLTDAWGGAVTVTLDGNGLPVLTYRNVPKGVCIAALLSSNNWTSVTVNGTAQASTSPSAAQATAACTSAANTIAWGFA
jgi:hypothetical protein